MKLLSLPGSMMKLGLAVSLFGAGLAAGLVLRRKETAEALDAIADAADSQMGKVASSAYHMGDNFQHGLVDTFGRIMPGRRAAAVAEPDEDAPADA